MRKNLVIINNEKCSIKENGLYCENIEIKSLSENLKNKYNIKFLLRKGNITPVYKIDKSNTKISSNILSFIKCAHIFVLLRRYKLIKHIHTHVYIHAWRLQTRLLII